MLQLSIVVCGFLLPWETNEAYGAFMLCTQMIFCGLERKAL